MNTRLSFHRDIIKYFAMFAMLFESHFIHFYGGRYILGGAFTDIGYFTAITMCYF